MSLTNRIRTLLIDLLVRFVHLTYPLGTLIGLTSHHAKERTHPTGGLATTQYQQSCQPGSATAARSAAAGRTPYDRYSQDEAIQPGQSRPVMRYRRYRSISENPMLSSTSQAAGHARSLPSGRAAPGQMVPGRAAANQAALGRMRKPRPRVRAAVRRPGLPGFPIRPAGTRCGRAALMAGLIPGN